MSPPMRAVNTTSVTEPTPEPAVAHALPRTWTGLCVLVVAAWLLLLGWRTVGAVGEAGVAAARSVRESSEQRIQRVVGLGPDFLATLRRAVEDGGAETRLVLYSPYGGQAFELDGADPRGEPARQARGLFERCKNLLYPHPRDVRFARDAEELRGHAQGAQAGRFLVVDGTQDDSELTVGGRYELLCTSAPGGPRLRLWRLRGGA